MSTTVEVKLCSGARKGIEKIDTNSLLELEGDVINIKLYPSSISSGDVIINVSLLREDWELFEADQYVPTITWSEVDYFSVVGNSVFVVTDHDDFFYGLTRIEVPNPPACDVKTILLTGSKSGDFYQWPAHIISDGLIGSEPTNLPYITYANLIPGELLWANFLFVNSSNFNSHTSGYRAPGITGGTITDRQWFIEDLVYIYEVYYEGLTGWFFNSQCTVLNIGQWVFLNTDLVTSLENEENFSIPYGTELDNTKSFILPMSIQGQGPQCDIWYNQSKYYSNIRYVEGIITDKFSNTANVMLPSLNITGNGVNFYCQGPSIDHASGDQFLEGDRVLVMILGTIGIYTSNMKIVGSLPFTIMPVKNVAFVSPRGDMFMVDGTVSKLPRPFYYHTLYNGTSVSLLSTPKLTTNGYGTFDGVMGADKWETVSINFNQLPGTTTLECTISGFDHNSRNSITASCSVSIPVPVDVLLYIPNEAYYTFNASGTLCRIVVRRTGSFWYSGPESFESFGIEVTLCANPTIRIVESHTIFLFVETELPNPDYYYGGWSYFNPWYYYTIVGTILTDYVWIDNNWATAKIYIDGSVDVKYFVMSWTQTNEIGTITTTVGDVSVTVPFFFIIDIQFYFSPTKLVSLSGIPANAFCLTNWNDEYYKQTKLDASVYWQWTCYNPIVDKTLIYNANYLTVNYVYYEGVIHTVIYRDPAVAVSGPLFLRVE